MNQHELEKKIRQIMAELSNAPGYVSSVDVLMKLGYLTKADYEKWRFGKVDYLERVCGTNLHKLSTINKLIKQISKSLNYKPSLTAYNKYGKGPKTRLCFSKTGIPNIEDGYATHYLNTYLLKKKEEAKKDADEDLYKGEDTPF